MIDRLEDFLMNKYFAKEKVAKRIYFKAVDVAQLEYYLKEEEKINSP